MWWTTEGVVGDEHIGQPVLLLKVLKQIDDLRLKPDGKRIARAVKQAGEDVLDDDGTAETAAEGGAERLDDRDDGVRQRVDKDDAAAREPLGGGGHNIVRADDLRHARAR